LAISRILDVKSVLLGQSREKKGATESGGWGTITVLEF